MKKVIKVTNAKVHNLKSVSLEIPKNSLTVFTGPSGSGKSSLAFDTIFIEGQRRYIESLSSYARQFLGQFQPPDVESIEGLSPAIAIDQKSTSNNPRSTVGTITEIYDYMRVLFARVGTCHCPGCNSVVQSQSAQQIVNDLLELPEKTKLIILAPVVKNRKGEHKELLHKFAIQGYSRVRIDGEILPLDDNIKMTKTKYHDIDIVVDRIVVKNDIKSRLTDSVELALKLAEGSLFVLVNSKEQYFSEKNYCQKCDLYFPDVNPRIFSFNSPQGACQKCNGLGELKAFHLDSLIIDDGLSIEDGAILPLKKKNSFLLNMVKSILEAEGHGLDTPLNKLPKKIQNILFEGSSKKYTYSFKSENSTFNFKKEFPGIIQWLEKKYSETTSEKVRLDLEEYMNVEKCQSCLGKRLNAFALSIKISKNSIMDVSDYSLQKAYEYFENIKLKGEKKIIAEKLLFEITSRLGFLNNVGLKYLTLNRSASTLSGGEAQRIRLATQIGSALSGVLYVLDEPSIGLHQRDNDRLIETLKNLRDIGNTVIVVEHDEDTMIAADHIVDIGPHAGIHGGKIVAQGNLSDIKKSKSSITGQYLNGKIQIEVPETRVSSDTFLKLKGAKQNNLKSINIQIPSNGLTCITGVSGSGKSTLIHEVLVPAFKQNLKSYKGIIENRKNFQSLTGVDEFKSIIELDQSAIGRTPKSNPATYTGLFTEIRTIFANTNEAKVRGHKAGRFSFNVKGGRCESCEGSGVKKIEMHFLPDVYITCAECGGTRYNDETLNILYRGKNIHDVLSMSVEEALDFFKNHKKVARILKTLNDVGLGYIKLGQPATTLSGGEAQRMKLSKELSKSVSGKCLYILDEPTTGLHFNDIRILLNSLSQLTDQGHAILIIEHNLDVIKTADYVIDLGPEGGEDGGEVIATGTPEEVSKVSGSYTGKYLKKVLARK